MSYKSTHTGSQIDAGVSAALNPDATPTLSSTNLVTSGGVAAKLSEKQDTLVFDNAPASGSNNPVKSGGIYTALADKASNADLALKANAANLAPAFDSTATYAIGDLVLYSGKVYRFTAAHTGAWDAGDVEQTTLGEEVEALDAAKADKTDVATADAALEQMILASFPTDGISNVSVASFADGADNIPVKSLTVNIDPVQAEGTPTPENPLPISGWTGATVTDDGGNLLDGVTWTSGYYIAADGTVTPVASGQYCDYMPVDASKPYALDSNGVAVAGGNYRVHAYDAEKNWLAQAAIASPTSSAPLVLAVTLPTGSKYVRLSIPYGASYDTSDYIFHAKRSSTVSWQSAAGTVYGGTLTYNGDGTWTLVKTMVGVDMGTMTWEASSQSGCFYTNSINDYKNVNNMVFYCSEYKPDGHGSTGDVYGTDNTIRYFFSKSSGRAFNVHDNAQAGKTGEQFASAVSGVILVYELATPAAPITLTADSVKTLLGSNNIFADCGDIASLTYRADVGLYIDKKLAEA